LLLLKQLFGAGSTPEGKQNLFEQKSTCRITYTPSTSRWRDLLNTQLQYL